MMVAGDAVGRAVAVGQPQRGQLLREPVDGFGGIGAPP